jgi:hypothetical protein
VKGGISNGEEGSKRREEEGGEEEVVHARKMNAKD